MNDLALAQLNIGGILVTPTTSVLCKRTLLPEIDPVDLPLFGHNVWNLRAGVRDRHGNFTIHWRRYHRELVEDTKLYTLALLVIVEDAPCLPGARSDFPNVGTVYQDINKLKPFLEWLAKRSITSFAQVTRTDLDAYLHHVQDLEAISTGEKRKRLTAVQRLHLYRDVLPQHCRLPDGLLWGGASAAELADDPGPSRVNRTPAIHPDVMEPLLSAVLLTIGPIAADLLPVARRLLELRTIAQQVAIPERHLPKAQLKDAGTNRWQVNKTQLDRVLSAFMERGQPLPAMPGPNRSTVLDSVGLGVAAWTDRTRLKRNAVQQQVAATGLPLKQNLLRVTKFSVIGDCPWRDRPLDADELVDLIRHVITACYLAVSYLSGVRMGESLNLRHGCISRNRKLGLIFMSGEQEKADGNRRERSPRTIPWVVVEEVAAAVAILETLSDGPLLFGGGEFCTSDWMTQSSHRPRAHRILTEDILEFITWFNTQIASVTGETVIPPDDNGTIHPARLRRTLAWHIARRPGGTVAGATQYGHVLTSMFQGYAGLADSGFRDELDFEMGLVRAEDIHNDAMKLKAGEHVSGPAAGEYRDRLASHARFVGQTLTTTVMAKNLLASRESNIYHGELVTCVFKKSTAACQQSDEDEPDFGRCKLSCSNIARTDRDIASVKNRADDLEADLLDVLPEPIRERVQARIDRYRTIIDDHESSRPADPAGGEAA